MDYIDRFTDILCEFQLKGEDPDHWSAIEQELNTVSEDELHHAGVKSCGSLYEYLCARAIVRHKERTECSGYQMTIWDYINEPVEVPGVQPKFR